MKSFYLEAGLGKVGRLTGGELFLGRGRWRRDRSPCGLDHGLYKGEFSIDRKALL